VTRRLPSIGLSLRGRLAGLLAVVAAVALAAAVLGSRATASNDYRVDVIFDTAKGIIPGQLVKIAGARAGTIKDIVLTPDYKARIEMQVDSRFAPFRSDAHCDIQSEGLIAERFVQCDPGTAGAPPLTAQRGKPPTIPVTHTFVPVSFTDLFNIWQLPVRQRLSLLVAGLGLGLAGRGDDLNDVLRRSNPTLVLVRQAVSLLNAQRRQLADAVVSTDRVVAQLAPRSDRVASFIDHAARVTQQTGDRKTQLAEAVRRLPGLLDATKPALHRLDTLASAGTPVLSDLRATAPDLTRLVRRLTPFSRYGVPALQDLGSALTYARPQIKRLQPVIQKLREFAAAGLPTGQLVEQLFTSLRDRGFVEGLLDFVYYTGAVLARYDGTSHVLGLTALLNSCSVYATAPVAGCSANFTGPAASAPASLRHAAQRPEQPPAPVRGPASKPTLALPKLPAIKLPGLPRIQLPAAPRTPKIGLPKVDLPKLTNLLDYLLG
jgi:virulence factor Mce-like protein